MREVAKYYKKWEKVDFSWHHIFDLDLLHIFFAPLTSMHKFCYLNHLFAKRQWHVGAKKETNAQLLLS